MNSTITKTDSNAVVFAGRPAVEVFRAKTLATALRLYAKTGMKVNRAYTPTNMLATATAITGEKFKRGQFEQAAEALTKWAEAQQGTTVNVG